jgi:hypothetical protein
VSLLAAALVVTCAAGCGRAPTEQSRVRAVLDRLVKATADRDFRRLCDDVLAQSLVRQVEATGVPCADALRAGLGGVRQPRLTVRALRVRGKRAYATVHTTATGQRPSDDTVRLDKTDGEWRVTALANAGG